MDELDKHHVVLNFHNKTFTFLDEERKHMIDSEINFEAYFYKGYFIFTIEEML